ncbi:hypothetical protein J6590_050847 [Homalodisca vitripennis]|nr:hypothetical protein J6590_050847 [Homalodisca vitripennis]
MLCKYVVVRDVKLQCADVLPRSGQPDVLANLSSGSNMTDPNISLVVLEKVKAAFRFKTKQKVLVQSPSPRVASDPPALSRLVSYWIVGQITRHGHLRKHLHRINILSSKGALPHHWNFG